MADFDTITDNSEGTPEEKADAVIGLMTTAAAAGGAVPFVIGWPIFAAAVGGGVVAIGRCYGVKLDKDGAWKLIRQFIYAAGFTFFALTVGSKFLAAILSATGGGYFVAAPLDAAVSGAIAYAVGKCGKMYFQGETRRDVFGKAMREFFTEQRKAP